VNKRSISIILTVAGLALLGGGLYLIKSLVDPQGIMQTLPYILVGLGCGLFGHGVGEMVNYTTLKNHPEIRRQKAIEEQDERNIAIAERTKARSYDIMMSVFPALMFAFVLMNVEMRVILFLVFVYLFVVGFSIFYRIRLEKEM